MRAERLRGWVRALADAPRLRLRSHIAAGAGVGLVATFADLIFALAYAGPSAAFDRGMVIGFLHMLALSVPLWTLLGCIWGLAMLLLAPTDRVAHATLALFSPRRLIRRDVAASSDVWTVLLCGVSIALVEARTVLSLQARVHRPENAAYGAAIAGVAWCGALLLFAPRVRQMLLAVATRASWFARPVALLLAVAVAIASYAFHVRHAPPEWLRASTPYWIWVPVGACFLYAALVDASATLFARRPRIGLWSACVPPLLLILSGLSYGAAHGSRFLVEEWAPASRVLIRIVRSATDHDGDGYARYFGGGDCNDRRADVYPSAYDAPGDGVDADCFDGDGTRPYEALHADQRVVLAGAPTQPNIVLITIDALRPDHLGCGKYRRITSPNIDALCAHALLFSQTSAAAPRSVRSVPAMLTGLYPAQIAFGDENIFPSLDDSVLTLAEALPDAYITGADIGTRYFAQMRGLFQGFDELAVSTEYKPRREDPVDRAIARIDGFAKSGRPFLEWVHLFDVHEPTLVDGRKSEYGDNPAGRYDTEVRIADGHVGRLWAALAERNLLDRTVVVVASDHGEALGEHGTLGHSSSLFQEQIASVLIVRIPGVEARRVTQPVSLIDLAPTLVHLAGGQFPRPIAGNSLLRFAAPGKPAPETVFAEVLPDGVFPIDIRMVREGDEKLVYWPQAQRFALYDLAEDPGELHDVSEDRPAHTAHLRDVLLRWLATTHAAQFDRNAVIRAAVVPTLPPGLRGDAPQTFDGAITFLGAELLTPQVRRGSVVRFALYFRADAATSHDLFFDIVPVPNEGPATSPELRMGHFPVRGAYHTHQWRPGQIVRDEVSMRIPADSLAPFTAHYALRVLDGRTPVAAVSNGRTTTEVGLFDLEVRR